MNSSRQTALETTSAGYRRLIYVLIGGVPLSFLSPGVPGVERRSTSRPKTSLILGCTAKADASIIGFNGQFCSGIHLSASSMVHLRPILAILRRFGLPCFVALGLLAFGFCMDRRSKAYAQQRQPRNVQQVSNKITMIRARITLDKDVATVFAQLLNTSKDTEMSGTIDLSGEAPRDFLPIRLHTAS